MYAGMGLGVLKTSLYPCLKSSLITPAHSGPLPEQKRCPVGQSVLSMHGVPPAPTQLLMARPSVMSCRSRLNCVSHSSIATSFAIAAGPVKTTNDTARIIVLISHLLCRSALGASFGRIAVQPVEFGSLPRASGQAIVGDGSKSR